MKSKVKNTDVYTSQSGFTSAMYFPLKCRQQQCTNTTRINIDDAVVDVDDAGSGRLELGDNIY